MTARADGESDRDHWNARHSERDGPGDPSPFLTGIELLPRRGRALDVAGGAGRNALWLAERGLDVTVADVSDVALAMVGAEAAARGLAVETIAVDLTAAGLPGGDWDLIIVFHYLDRRLYAGLSDALATGGLLVVSVATRRNLERHLRPPLPYLVEEGELPGLIGDAEVVLHEEGWFDDRHEAHLVARALR